MPILKWARAQGAVVGYTHSGAGLIVTTTELPNYEMPRYDGIGANEYVVDVTHDADKIAKVIKINEQHVKLFAHLLERLKATPDGDGNLLDHSLLLYGSSLGDGNLHTHHDLPIVLVGGGARQVKGNRHIVCPRETPLNNLLLSMLEQAGVPAEKFGDSTGKLDCFK